MLVNLAKKDIDTYKHCLRAGKLAKMMAVYLKFNEEDTRRLVVGCCLHDIGKILISDSILKKTSALTAHEWGIMKSHPSLGVQLMKTEEDIDEEIIHIIGSHHERWDGMGYPHGLHGPTIPVAARICSIIDAFDCMISDRPYRKGLSVQQAKEELLRHSSRQFDKYYVDMFLNIPEQGVLDIQRFSPSVSRITDKENQKILMNFV